MALKMTAQFTFSVLMFLFLIGMSSSSSPTMISNPDWYEVRDGSYSKAHRVDDSTAQWTQQVSLERLEVLANDMALHLPFESCTEEKLTRQNKYADHLGQNSKFEEVHQVLFSFCLLI